jgi:hypothetical protein
MAAGIVASGMPLGRLIASGEGGVVTLAALATTLILVALWVYGQSSRCDTCGVP